MKNYTTIVNDMKHYKNTLGRRMESIECFFTRCFFFFFGTDFTYCFALRNMFPRVTRRQLNKNNFGRFCRLIPDVVVVKIINKKDLH